MLLKICQPPVGLHRKHFVFFVKLIHFRLHMSNDKNICYPKQVQKCCVHSHDDVPSAISVCISDIRTWMIQNKLKRNDNKTEFLLITSSIKSKYYGKYSSIYRKRNYHNQQLMYEPQSYVGQPLNSLWTPKSMFMLASTFVCNCYLYNCLLLSFSLLFLSQLFLLPIIIVSNTHWFLIVLFIWGRKGHGHNYPMFELPLMYLVSNTSI